MASKPELAYESGIYELPKVVNVTSNEDDDEQRCQKLYEGNPVLLGYDVVQYHFIKPFREGGEAVRGKPEHAYNFNGYQFWFSSEKNRELFKGDPWKYAPAWGGFCSWGVALELPPTWPWKEDFLGPPASPWEGWLIVDDVLMFNIWDGYSQRFLNDGENGSRYARLAAQRWKDWWNGTLTAGPFNTHCIGHGPLKNWCLSQQPSPWLQPLSDCGMVVSDKNDFNDFSNDTLSPYHKKLRTGFIVGGSLLVAIVLGIIGYCFYRSQKRRSLATSNAKRDDTTQNVPSSPSANNTNSDESAADDYGHAFQDEPVDVAVAID